MNRSPRQHAVQRVRQRCVIPKRDRLVTEGRNHIRNKRGDFIITQPEYHAHTHAAHHQRPVPLWTRQATQTEIHKDMQSGWPNVAPSASLQSSGRHSIGDPTERQEAYGVHQSLGVSSF